MVEWLLNLGYGNTQKLISGHSSGYVLTRVLTETFLETVCSCEALMFSVSYLICFLRECVCQGGGGSEGEQES